jgi:hypothetical protein
MLSTNSLYVLLVPTPSSAHLNATSARPAPSTLLLANLHAAAAPPAHLPTYPAYHSVSHALKPSPVSNPAQSFPIAIVLKPHSAIKTAVPQAVTSLMVLPFVSEHLQAPIRRAAAPTAALQPMSSTSAPKVHSHPPSAPAATAHAGRALPAAFVLLQAKSTRSCANQARTLALSAQHPAPRAPQALFRKLLVRLHAPSALPAPIVLQLRHSRAAAPSTRMPPFPVAPAPAGPALGKLCPPRGKASA